MKKIALCSLAVFLAFGNAWGAECKTTIDFTVWNNNWSSSSNEYLFPKESDYLAASWQARVYECDNEYCGNNTYVRMPANHVFKGKTITEERYYRCDLGFGDSWEKIDASEASKYTLCTKDRISGWVNESNEYLYPTINDWQAMMNRTTGQVYECDSNACAHGSTITLSAGHYFLGKKVGSTRTYKCADGDYWLDITDDIKPADCPTCQKTLPSEVTPVPMPAPMPAPAPKKTCKELYPNGSKERLACCYAGAATKWTGDERNGTCTCVDTTLVWNGAKCIQKSQETDCYYTFMGSVMCANGGIINANTRIKLTKDDLNGNTCASFESLLARDSSKVTELANKYCNALDTTPTPTPNPNSVPAQPTINSAEISGARDRLARFFGDVDDDRSVWKNADGSFNATRLASDLTAGVVLGTVGGVVSGVLIKKSQIEKGFDALNCTVGGQKVADWGDEFRVGFRR